MGLMGPSGDEVFTTWPGWAPWSIRGTKARMPFTTPVTFTPKTQRQSFGVVSQIFELGAPTPALLQSTWHAPKRSYTASARASTEASSLTSVRTAVTAAPPVESSPAAAASAGSSMSAMTTVMPWATKALARASPIPLAPPVTTATLPLRSCMCLLPVRVSPGLWWSAPVGAQPLTWRRSSVY